MNKKESAPAVAPAEPPMQTFAPSVGPNPDGLTYAAIAAQNEPEAAAKKIAATRAAASTPAATEG